MLRKPAIFSSCSNLLKSWTFCEHITSRPSFGLGKRRRTRTLTTLANNEGQQQERHDEDEQQQQRSAAKLPHLLIYVGQASPSNSYLPILVPNISNDSNWHTEVSNFSFHFSIKMIQHFSRKLLSEVLSCDSSFWQYRGDSFH